MKHAEVDVFYIICTMYFRHMYEFYVRAVSHYH